MTEHKDKAARMRMLVAKFPNSKPEAVPFQSVINASIGESSLSPKEGLFKAEFP